jgi:hypothetical protein
MTKLGKRMILSILPKNKREKLLQFVAESSECEYYWSAIFDWDVVCVYSASNAELPRKSAAQEKVSKIALRTLNFIFGTVQEVQESSISGREGMLEQSFIQIAAISSFAAAFCPNSWLHGGVRPTYRYQLPRNEVLSQYYARHSDIYFVIIGAL